MPAEDAGPGGTAPARGIALASLAVAVVAVSWAAILIRLAQAHPLAIAYWRLALAVVLLTPLALLRPQSTPGPSPWLVGAAGLLLAAHFALWISSLFLTSVASSVMLVSTQPLFAAFLAGPLLGEPPPRRTWGAAALSVSGAVVIAAGDHAGGARAVLGDLMALAAAGAAAVYLILGRRARGRGSLARYFWRVNATACLVLLAVCVVGGIPLWGYPGATWAALAGLAAGPHLAGHGLLNLAVRHLPAPAVNLSLAGEPILSTSYAAWLFAEAPRGTFYLGAGLVLAGLVVEFAPPLVRGRRR